MTTAQPRLVNAATIKPTRVEWLWRGRIPAGSITVLTGRPGLGKSFIATDIAARTTRGHQFPDGAPCEPGGVLILDAENDPASVLVPRLLAAGADPAKVEILEGTRQVHADGATIEGAVSLADVDVIRESLGRLARPRLLIVDPIGSFIGQGVDSSKDPEVRRMLAPIAATARETGVAVLLVAHDRKTAGDSADASVMGSTAFVGVARAVWHVRRPPRDDEAPDPRSRLFLPGKSNLGRRAPGWAFRIDGDEDEAGRVTWLAESGHDADDLEFARQVRKRAAPKVDQAAELLRRELKDGPRPATEVEDVAEGAGVSKSTLERARRRLGVRSDKSALGGGWLLSMPTEGPHIVSVG